MKNRAEQWMDWHSSHYYKEVYWLDWKESECGRAWEQTMFGGHVAPINNKVDGSHGIALSDWPPQGTQNDPERRVWNTISMRYIEKLFQMNTWQRRFNLNDWRIFHVPRDGATSLYINSFTTMSASEEQRVAREEVTEAIALANAQPAKKKRVKATGRTEERRPQDEKIIEETVVEEQEQQPQTPTQRVHTSDGKRRASSPEALPAQRLILAPHIRRPRSGLVTVPERPSSQLIPPQQTIPTPLPSNQPKPLDNSTAIYPAHSASLTNTTPSEPTSTTTTIQKLKSQPKGLLAAYRERRRIGLAKKEAEAKKRRDLADRTNDELQLSLMREAELKKRLEKVEEELRRVRDGDGDEGGRRRALASKGEVETRERARRRNRVML